MKKFYLFLILSVLSTFAYAQELTLDLASESETTILGLPIRLEATIGGKKPFILHGRFGIDCHQHGGIIVTDKSGNRVNFSSGAPCPQVSESPFASQSKVEYKGRTTGTIEVFLPPGNYNVQAYYHSEGPYLDRYSDTDQRPVAGIWEGHARSNTISVEVKIPEGDDRNALLNLGPAFNGTAQEYAMFMGEHRLELLKEYPKSVYAATIIMRYLERPEENDPKQLLKIVKTFPYFPSGTAMPDSDSPTGWRSLPAGKAAAEWQINKATQILREHPEFPHKERLELVLGINNLVLGKTDEAKQWLIRAANGKKEKHAKWAKEFLTELQQEEAVNNR